MSDVDDLDEEEINRQLAELGSDIDTDELDLSDMEGLDDIDLEDLEDEGSDFDDEEHGKQVDEEIAQLVKGLTGPELCKTLREKLTQVLKANDKILQVLARKEADYESLKTEVFGRKDAVIVKLEEEIDSLNDLLEDEEREGANMYTVFKRAEKELVEVRAEHTKFLAMAEQLQNQHDQTMKRLNTSLKKCKEQSFEHQTALFKRVTELTDKKDSLENEIEEAKTQNVEKELRVEDLLKQRKAKENLVSDESKNASELIENQDKELEDLHAQYAQLIQDTEDLENSSKQLKEQVDVINKEYREVNRKQTKITLDYDDAERLIQKHERDSQRQTKQAERLEQEIEDLRQQRKEVLKKIAAS